MQSRKRPRIIRPVISWDGLDSDADTSCASLLTGFSSICLPGIIAQVSATIRIQLTPQIFKRKFLILRLCEAIKLSANDLGNCRVEKQDFTFS